MVFLKPNEQESKIRNEFVSFLKKKYKCKVHKNKVVSSLFAPGYYTIQGNKKKRIFILRSPPSIPYPQIDDIKLALSNGIGVYILIYYNKEDRIIENFQSECEKLGVGIINYSGIKDFEIRYPSIIDFPPKDDIIEDRIKVFLSSKLWKNERDIARSVIKEMKHQPIQIERLVLNGTLEDECLKWVDKSQFLLGIVTLEYSELVTKEIKQALSTKPKRTLVYVNTDCEKFIQADCEKFKDKKLKTLCKLIQTIQKKKVYRNYINNVDLKKKLRRELHDFISQVSIEALKSIKPVS